MTKTAATSYEVRWRKNSDPANLWSTPVAVGADGHVNVPGLERVTDYAFEARAVSACGAKSAWVLQTFNLPDVPAGTLTLADLKTEADNASADAAYANAQLADIASDSILSPAEKPTVMRDYSVITSEQAGIDAQADAYGVSRTDYDNAISALTSYLGTLTTATAWNDKSGNTTIVGPTFRANFNTVYTTRQTLLNAIYAAAKGLANNAQGTANTALDQLGNLSNSQYLQNPFFSTGDLTGWTSDHGSVYYETGGNGPSSASTSYAVFPHGTAAEALRNVGRIPVYPGAVIKAQCAVRGVGTPNGTCGVRISWRDATDAEISNTPTPNPSTGNATNGTYVTATAPAGAMFAHVECATSGRTDTGGYYTVDNFAAWALADSLDQVPDGSTRFAAAQAGADKTASNPQASTWLNDSVNLARGGDSITRFGGRTLDNVGDSASRFAAAETGADKTGNHTSSDTSNVGGVPVAQVLSPGQNMLPNPSGALGVYGWLASNCTISAGVDAAGYYLDIHRLSSGIVQALATVSFLASQALLSAGVDIMITDGSGQIIALDILSSPSGNLDTADTTGEPFVYTRFTNSGTPTAAITAAQLRVYFSDGINRIRIRNAKLEFGPPTPYTENATTAMGANLRVPGSGATVGDQRNLVSSITRNSGLVRSATALTATSAGAVNVNAHTITMGAAAIGYNAVPNAVTGLSVGSGYYIYTRDNYAGGTQAWAANGNATTVNGFDDAYNAGYVTIPSSGSSGGGGAGGGGGGSCVCADMYLRAGLTARDIAERWRWWKPWLWFLRGREGWHLIRRRPRIVQEICMRLTVADGSTIDCSVSTPITTQSGESVQAPMAYGRMVWTDSGWQRVIECESLRGERDVVRICVGGHSFLAGANPFHRIDTHNVWKP